MSKAPTIIEAFNSPALFGRYFAGPSWDCWRAILHGAFALPMSAAEAELFRDVTGREPPAKRVRELDVVAGRRSGKDSVASFIGAYVAATFQPNGRTRPGERPVVLLLGADRSQARGLLNYVKGYFTEVPALAALVQRETQDGLELTTGVDIIVATSDFRLVRGRTVLLAIFNEVSFWMQEGSASPDVETFRAVMPAMATLGDQAMLIMISSAHRRSGLLYSRWEKFYGVDNPDTLVVHTKTSQLNPTISLSIIEAAMADDPQSAAAEYNSVWRDDLAGFCSRDDVLACVDQGVTVRPPQASVRYVGFLDASSGKADSTTLGVASRDGESGILHCALEIPSPHDPIVALSTIAATLKSYGCSDVWGDKYAIGFTEAELRRHGINLRHSPKTRSDLYRELLPMIRSRRVRMLDIDRAVVQFAALERRALPGGGERIDHPAHGDAKDDLSNAIAGALVMATAEEGSCHGWMQYIDNEMRKHSEAVRAVQHTDEPEFGTIRPGQRSDLVRVRLPDGMQPVTVFGASGSQYTATPEQGGWAFWMLPDDAHDLLSAVYGPHSQSWRATNQELAESLRRTKRAAAFE
ncbi:hypothetical protein [uncultured Bradyrhizobium sp.]|uniref:hypothetical protein n=1 Tax=Bradyrhizobium sp. TaxID=376 RepID=UPI00260CEEDC|nr:hypothetical protein [uncultured Bradyrhizobium sp.]